MLQKVCFYIETVFEYNLRGQALRASYKIYLLYQARRFDERYDNEDPFDLTKKDRLRDTRHKAD